MIKKRKQKTPENNIFSIFTKTIPCSPSNTSALYSNHSYTTCGYNAPQCTSRKHPNMIRTHQDRKKAKFPQNKEIITDRTQTLTPAPRPKVIAGHPPTPRHATATTLTPQPHTMDVHTQWTSPDLMNASKVKLNPPRPKSSQFSVKPGNEGQLPLKS